MKKQYKVFFGIEIDKPLNVDNILVKDWNHFTYNPEKYIELGEQTVELTIPDTDAKAVLEAQLVGIDAVEQKLKADYIVALGQVTAARNNLLSIENKADTEVEDDIPF